MAEKDVQIGIRMAGSLREDLEKLAKADDRKLSAYCEIVLRRHVEEEKDKQRITKKK